jgi:hypothetical protein
MTLGVVMKNITHSRRTFAERLRDAVEESVVPTSVERVGRHRSERRRVTMRFSAPVADRTPARHSDELFVDRLRKALD